MVSGSVTMVERGSLIAELHNSISWKITTPLCRMSRLLGTLRNNKK